MTFEECSFDTVILENVALRDVFFDGIRDSDVVFQDCELESVTFALDGASRIGFSECTFDNVMIRNRVQGQAVRLGYQSPSFPEGMTLEGRIDRVRVDGVARPESDSLYEAIEESRGSLERIDILLDDQPESTTVSSMFYRGDYLTTLFNLVELNIRACQTITDFCVLGAAGWIV